jgi:hypothetical protein
LKVYELSTFSRRDPVFCRLLTEIDGIGLNGWRWIAGAAFRPGDYPENAKIRMTDEDPAMVVPDFVPNTHNMLIVSRRVKEVIERETVPPVEYFPLTIINHRGRPASTEHFVVNPVGGWDVLDRNASVVIMFKDKVVTVEKTVLDPKLVALAPGLFRLKEQPHRYMITERLVAEVRKLDPRVSNGAITPLEQSPER